MCGIVGCWAAKDRGPLDLAVFDGLRDCLAHRGPDARGSWTALDGRLAFGHTRLAIQDVSDRGRQPMTSRCGRYWLVLNGEIYNHWELRDRLGSGAQWRGRSDTETLLEAIASWGLKPALERANGMFALALWDAEKHKLFLARDRIGEKPLYWGAKQGHFFFASELAPILRSPLRPFPVSPEAVEALLNLGYVPEPLSILQDVHKLRPGAFLEVEERAGHSHRLEVYWSLSDAMSAAIAARPVRTDGEWTEEVEAALRRAVDLRLIADVPVGAFLSGGIDSGLVVALMSQVSAKPVRTFTVGMPRKWNEAPRARSLAAFLGTDHTEIDLTDGDCVAAIPELPRVYSEPLGDSSQIPTYLVSAVARRDVKVALSGDGGDELFAGYNRHFAARRIWQHLDFVPLVVRKALHRALAAPGSRRFAHSISGRLSNNAGAADVMRRLLKAVRLVGVASVAELYTQLVVQWPSGQSPCTTGGTWALALPDWVDQLEGLDPVEQLMAYDLFLALPGDMLVKLDRASMAHGLEARVPFLDHEFIQLALSVPPSLKAGKRRGKLLLRTILEKHAPPGWMHEPGALRKTGFGIPLAQWLRGPLRGWAEGLLSESELQHNPWIDSRTVQARWTEFLGGAPWEHPLWSALMLQAWLEEHRSQVSIK